MKQITDQLAFCQTSKIYERCMYKQMSIFFDEILSQYQCGFRKGFRSQHCLAPMLEKWGLFWGTFN